MKRSLTISVTMVVLLMLALFTYFHFINPFCGWGSNYGNLGKLGVASKSACDKSCVSYSDCQPFVGSCIHLLNLGRNVVERVSRGGSTKNDSINVPAAPFTVKNRRENAPTQGL